MGAGGAGGVGGDAPNVSGRASRSAVRGGMSSPGAERQAATAARSKSGEGSASRSQVRGGMASPGAERQAATTGRSNPNDSGKSEGGTPLFLTPNGLLIPNSSQPQEAQESAPTTEATTPSQVGTAPKRRAASLLTLGLADTTRKSLLGR